jgi:hypothetical protein
MVLPANQHKLCLGTEQMRPIVASEDALFQAKKAHLMPLVKLAHNRVDAVMVTVQNRNL